MLVTSPPTVNLTVGVSVVDDWPGVPDLSITLNEYSSLNWLSWENDKKYPWLEASLKSKIY